MPDLCQCRDPNCPYCKNEEISFKGDTRCGLNVEVTIYRLDKPDKNGVRMCWECASYAVDGDEEKEGNYTDQKIG